MEDNLKKYNELKAKGLILYECIVGSQAYGTNKPTSDIDKKFIYLDTIENVFQGTVTLQLDVNKDHVGYELGRYLELLEKQSPNMHELLWSPEDCILYCNELFRKMIINQRDKFLTKQIKFSFGEYAHAQIKKAKGLNKKINNKMDGPKKDILAFCWTPKGQGVENVTSYLKYNGLRQEHCGLAAIDHWKDTYHLFYDFPAHAIQDLENNVDFSVENTEIENFSYFANLYFLKQDYGISIKRHYEKISQYDLGRYKGIIKKDNISNDVCLSSVEKNANSLCVMHFNKDGYAKYCKEYQSYQTWVTNRNEARYQTNMSNGSDYDAKNMMHCVRLLDTCIEAFIENKINVKRQNREELLNILHGGMTYDVLITLANEKLEKLDQLYKVSKLPENIETEFLKKLLLYFRNFFYGMSK